MPLRFATVAITDDWLRYLLGLLVVGGTSAITSMAINTTQISNMEKRQDLDAAQIREIFRNRDEVDRVTREATKESIARLQVSVDRLTERMDNKFGMIDRNGYVLVQLVQLPELPKLPQIFDDELAEMRIKLDAMILDLKAGKLDTEDKRDEFYSLELDYEILKGWQIWCETSPERRTQCLQHFKQKEE